MAISYYIREIVWCRFEEEPNAIKPEFLGRHLAIILSTKNKVGWPHLVVPMTSSAQNEQDETIYKLKYPALRNQRNSWVICSHIYAVAYQRLKRPKIKIRVAEEDFEEIKQRCCLRLPFKAF